MALRQVLASRIPVGLIESVVGPACTWGSCSSTWGSRSFASPATQHKDVPEGHLHSDLSKQACNLALMRRRDIALRQDVRLNVDGKAQNLSEVFKGQKVVVFGVPDCGKVCSEQQMPGYARAADALRGLGVGTVLCVAVDEPAAVQGWAAKLGVDASKVKVAADTNGGFSRMLGVELEAPGAPGPKTMRYAALVDDGILLKLKVDKSPGDLAESSAETMVGVIKACL